VSDELARTPLHDRHLALGAKMVPFSGFEMPVQYQGIIAEHLHTRQQASLFDICHMGEFKIKGAAARKQLGRLVTHDLESLSPGRCRYGFMLNPEGGILDDLIIYCLADDDFMVVVNASRRESNFAWMKENMNDDLFFEDVSEYTAKIDLQGPESVQVLQDRLGGDWTFLKYFCFLRTEFEGDPLIVSRTGYTGELGYELYIRSERVGELWDLFISDERVKPAGLGARDTLRLEVGLPLYGHDLDEEHTPAESGGSFFLKSKVDYVGKDKAAEVRERLIPLELTGRRSARQGDAVLADGREVGRVTSGSFAPSLGHAVALAFVDEAEAAGERFIIRTGKTELEARRTELPFYKQGTARKKLQE
jgi:aminomethyltransferase